MVETFQVNRVPGSLATNLEYWTESDKPSNVAGSALVWLMPMGVVL
jgi:hypothetical protein